MQKYFSLWINFSELALARIQSCLECWILTTCVSYIYAHSLPVWIQQQGKNIHLYTQVATSSQMLMPIFTSEVTIRKKYTECFLLIFQFFAAYRISFHCYSGLNTSINNASATQIQMQVYVLKADNIIINL